MAKTAAEKKAEAEKKNGRLPIGTVDQILERAPTDLEEDTVEVPEWNCSVKIRTLTAAERAQIRQIGIVGGDDSWAEMEVRQFMLGVIEPRFDELQVRKLYAESGNGFSRVINAHDALSVMGKE